MRPHQPDAIHQRTGNRTMQPSPSAERSPGPAQDQHQRHQNGRARRKPDRHEQQRREMPQPGLRRDEGRAPEQDKQERSEPGEHRSCQLRPATGFQTESLPDASRPRQHRNGFGPPSELSPVWPSENSSAACSVVRSAGHSADVASGMVRCSTVFRSPMASSILTAPRASDVGKRGRRPLSAAMRPAPVSAPGAGHALKAHLRKLVSDVSEMFWVLPALMVAGWCARGGGLGPRRSRRGGPALADQQRAALNGGATGARTLLGAIVSSTIALAGHRAPCTRRQCPRGRSAWPRRRDARGSAAGRGGRGRRRKPGRAAAPQPPPRRTARRAPASPPPGRPCAD